MGKIRVKTIGDESAEREQEEKARKRAEAKRAASAEQSRSTKEAEAESLAVDAEETAGAKSEEPNAEAKAEVKETEETPKKKSSYAKKKKQKNPHSTKYIAVAQKLDRNKIYSLKDALSLLPELHLAKFDETVELHINTTEQGVSGSTTLPHGTGKQMRVAIANQTEDPKGVDELIKTVESGKIDFDILVATPDAMPKLARIAKFLGPKGLMPNPKNGTIHPKPETIAKKYEGGHMTFKTEAKAPIMHVAVGKMSFGNEKLAENIQSILSSVDSAKIVNVTLKSTMSPGIKISL